MPTPTPDLSLDDFTVTVDTENSGNDKIVLHLDRDGQPRLTLPFGQSQLLWALDDPTYFTGGYRTWIASNIITVHAEQGWTFEQIAAALGCSELQARQIHAQAVADAARDMAEAAAAAALESTTTP